MRSLAIAIVVVFAGVAAARADAVTANVYAQGDLTLTGRRDHLVVPLPPPSPPEWETRLFLDTRATWQIDDAVSFSYGGRFNLRAEDELGFPNRENIRNELREVYVSWQNGRGLFLELGRINLKSGVAEGFNPTDYFKTRAVVEPISSDPTVLREDRLGTAMLLGQFVWSGGSFTAVFAPKLSSDSPPYLNDDLPSFRPMFDRTNANTRALAKASFDLPGDTSSEFLAYDEAGQTRVGANITRGFGQAVIGYVEWSGGSQASLADNAFRDGLQNGVLSPPPPIPVSSMKSFMNDLAVGATYATRIGANLDIEYDHHQAGFSGADWRHWFAAGEGGNPQTDGALWFIRGYAADQQEPMARNSLFVRADWQNAFMRDLALTGFVDTDLRDGSGLAQLTADYYLSPRWTIGGLVDVDYGRLRSDFGSLPQSVSVLVRASRYF